ncbi:Ca2+/Na+ antiporter [Clostridium pascui]|uniref:hypothetical protein n=1 Tax=Clostridium pascui TaxID=46609 RepID=UPI00195A22E5|nr:hypothetical protein [Clostridium pascui]MBM7871489.1 Ca2+/Na+ antiporter [Clostridium pascui]
MSSLSIAEIIDSIPLIVLFVLVIYLSSSNDKHYHYRMNVSEYLRKIYLGNIKNGSVPLITFATAIQFYITLIITIIIRIKSDDSKLPKLLSKFLFVPWFYLICVIFLLEIIIYLKNLKYLNKKENKESKSNSKKKFKHKK